MWFCGSLLLHQLCIYGLFFCRFGVAMASCCHHRCNWATYVGQPFMEQIGFKPADFHLMTLMSSWAVCGIRSDNEDHGDTHSNNK